MYKRLANLNKRVLQASKQASRTCLRTKTCELAIHFNNLNMKFLKSISYQDTKKVKYFLAYSRYLRGVI